MAHARGAMCFPWENTLAFVNPHTKVKRPPLAVSLLLQGHKWLTRRALCVFRGKTRLPSWIPIRKQKTTEWWPFALAGAQTARASRSAAMCFPWENTLAFADPHTKTKSRRMATFCFGRGTKARTLDTRFWRPRKKSEKSHKYAILLKMTYILTYRNRRKRGFALFRLRFLLRFALYL